MDAQVESDMFGRHLEEMVLHMQLVAFPRG